jgi:hypothetical protein
MFVAAWFVLDTRLQWNFLRQARVTAQQYAGKSWEERHPRPTTRWFSHSSRKCVQLPPPPVRVFMVGDEHYFRDRGAYHLYPYNVSSNRGRTPCRRRPRFEAAITWWFSSAGASI